MTNLLAGGLPEPDSPCTGVCLLDRRTRWCTGCGRTTSEIARWPAADKVEKHAILNKLPQRLKMLRARSS